MKLGLLLSCGLILLGSTPVYAAPSSKTQRARTIQIEGRVSSTVTGDQLTLGELATVHSTDASTDDAVIALKNVVISREIKPGEQRTLSAVELLEHLRKAGVNINEITYTFPRIMTFSRAFQEIGKETVRGAVQDYFRRLGEETEVREVLMKTALRVAPGNNALEVQPLGVPRGNQQTFAVRVGSGESNSVRTEVQVVLNQWRSVPIIRRQILKGEIVGPEDVVMARMNLDAIPLDVAQDSASVVGLEAKRSIAAGEVIRREKLEIPAIIKAGERVTLRYKNELFEATATGVAIEAAPAQGSIRVRNEISKKVVSGIAVESGLVEVRP